MQHDIPTQKEDKKHVHKRLRFSTSSKTHIHFVPKLTNVVTHDIVSRGHSILCTARLEHHEHTLLF